MIRLWFGAVEGAFTETHREECQHYVNNELEARGIAARVAPNAPGEAERLIEIDSPVSPDAVLPIIQRIERLIDEWSTHHGRKSAPHEFEEPL